MDRYDIYIYILHISLCTPTYFIREALFCINRYYVLHNRYIIIYTRGPQSPHPQGYIFYKIDIIYVRGHVFNICILYTSVDPHLVSRRMHRDHVMINNDISIQQ